MTRNIVNPVKLHDPVPFGYSHVVSAPGETVFIAGQYGSDERGEVVSEDFTEQAEKAFDNLEVTLEAAGLGFGDVVRIGTFVVDHGHEKLETIAGLVHERWGNEPPAQTLIGVASLAFPDMLFEVEAVAVRPAATGDRA